MTPKRGCLLDGTERALKPPPRLDLSDWAEAHYYLSPESSAEPGRWRTIPYQRGMMNAITDPSVERVTVMKSARVGWTKMCNITIGYYMHGDPCPIMNVQPTVQLAATYSKEEVAPMLRDCPVFADIVTSSSAKKTSNTILAKSFKGGVLQLVGANSGAGFRAVSRKVVIFDEVDGYAASAGSDGDQIKLGIRRTEYYGDRKILAGSTPLIAGASRIEPMFEAGDQRRYHVPCPHCGHVDVLTFREESERGHWMAWDKGKPETAHFVCRKSGCIIEHSEKFRMLERGEWIADAEFLKHASFHIWAAYSMSPNATWANIAEEFLDSKDNPVELQTFVNTVLGETWQERGEAPDWERLQLRAEDYHIGTVPAGVHFLTAGVDVQHDRLEYEVVGWSLSKESWSVDSGILWGNTAGDEVWKQLDELLGRTFPGEDGQEFTIARMAVDAGYNTQQVYSWCRRYPMSRVIAVMGFAKRRVLIGTPSAVEVKANGRRMRRAYRMWPVGVDVAKAEFYGWLKLPIPDMELDEEHSPGYCHFPKYDREYFRQITAEQLMTVRKRDGFSVHEWQQIPGRENHRLDCRVYARAAASAEGLDRVVQPTPDTQAKPQAPHKQAVEQQDTPRRERRKGSFLSGGRGKGGWLGKSRR